MKKLLPFLLGVIILMMCIAIVNLYMMIIKLGQTQLDSSLTTAEGITHINEQLENITTDVDSLKQGTIIKTTNTTNQTEEYTVQTSPGYEPYYDPTMIPYNPDGVTNNYDTKKVSIKVDKSSLTDKTVDIIIKDENETTGSWGEPFTMEKLVGGEWKKLKARPDVAFNAIAYVIRDNKELKLTCNFDFLYGDLDKGTYRIVKECNVSVNPDNIYNYQIASDEFEIK